MKRVILLMLGFTIATADAMEVVCPKCLGCARPDDPSTWCPDINRDGWVDVSDLLGVLGEWGTCPIKSEDDGNKRNYARPMVVAEVCTGDINGDDFVDITDLLILLRSWSPASTK